MFKVILSKRFASQVKDSAKEFAQSIAKDAQKVATNARNTLQEDFEKAGGAAANASEVIDEKVRGTKKERFHAAQEAAERAEKADNKFVMSEHAENPFNKATKMASDAKDAVKEQFGEWKEAAKDKMNKASEKMTNMKDSASEKMTNMKDSASETVSDSTRHAQEISSEAVKRAQQSKEGFSESHESIGSKIENSAEKIAKKVKDTINSVAEAVKGTAKEETDPLFHAKIDPMGGEKTTLQKPQMTPKTEELQKKGAKHKKEEDSFNLM